MPHDDPIMPVLNQFIETKKWFYCRRDRVQFGGAVELILDSFRHHELSHSAISSDFQLLAVCCQTTQIHWKWHLSESEVRTQRILQDFCSFMQIGTIPF